MEYNRRTDMAIKVLDSVTINKIAAGEVIERPSSVVKELVENAIDAKATAVTIEIKDGGISFIRITDNGQGFEKDDIPVAFLRHSTSKIQSVEDLMTVSSLGFRGEALSSISAVAQIELITKTHESLMGTRYVIEGGKEKQLEAVGCPDGTTFIIRNLFYNTPARRKFLKTPVTEGNYIAELVEKLAMSHPDVSFRFISNNQNKLHTSGNGNIKEIIYHVYGRDISANLLPVSYESEHLNIVGFIGKPVVNRGNRNFENYYINGRFIKSNIINKAIEEAYKSFMMQHKYPFTALHFTIDQNLLDVNVHPTKMELRFSNGEEIYNVVLDVITKALTHKEFIPDVTLFEKEKKNAPKPEKPVRMPEPFEVKRQNEESQKETVKNETAQKERVTEKLVQQQAEALQTLTKPSVTMPQAPAKPSDNTGASPGIFKEPSVYDRPQVESVQITKAEQTAFLLDEKNSPQHKIIGQVFSTYWLVEFEDKLYIIDQHAAHEKVLYERIMAKYKINRADSQNLMPPVVVTLGASDIETLNEHMEHFAALGYEIEEFGGRDYAIKAVPMELFGLNEKDVFMEILDELSAGNYKTVTSVTDRMATIACKAAVKGNNRLSEREAKALIDELMGLENPYNCPHGRPTIISMSKYELEKKFKRIV